MSMTNKEIALKYIPGTIEILKTGWTKENTAKDRFGRPISPESPYAVCWCLIGAMAKRSGKRTIYENIKEYIFEKTIGLGFNSDNAFRVGALSNFNDAQDSVEPIIALLEYVISPEDISQ